MPIAAREAGDPAWLFYTSGTTGRPKGVTLTQKNVMAAILNYFSDVDAIAPGDAIIHAAPMSHGSGFYMLPHVAHAGLNVVPESGGFDAPEIYALLQAHRGVTMFAAPTMVKRLVDFSGDAAAAISRPSSTAAARCTWPIARRRWRASASSSRRFTARANRR